MERNILLFSVFFSIVLFCFVIETNLLDIYFLTDDYDDIYSTQTLQQMFFFTFSTNKFAKIVIFVPYINMRITIIIFLNMVDSVMLKIIFYNTLQCEKGCKLDVREATH